MEGSTFHATRYFLIFDDIIPNIFMNDFWLNTAAKFLPKIPNTLYICKR